MRIIQSQSPRPLNLLAVGPNGLVAAASSGFDVPGIVEVWDAGTARPITNTLREHRTESLVFLHGGEYLFVGRGPNSVTLDPATGDAASFLSLLESNWWHRLVLAADDSHLLASDSAICVGRVAYYAVVGDLRFRCLWSDGGTAFRWFNAFAVSRDGSTVALADQSESDTGRPDLHLSLRDGPTGQQRVAIPLDPSSPPRQLAFTADGSKLLARTDSRTVQLFDAVSGGAAGELVHPGRPFVTGIAIHPRGPVACARTNGTVTLWDAEKREQLRTLDWKAGKLVSVAFSPDGALAAAGTEDGKIVVWDVDF